MLKFVGVLLVLALADGVPAMALEPSDAQLLRKRYHSEVTGKDREYYIFLPRGYGADVARRWPLILFLHGAGERGDGLADLEKVLVHGPLTEAWILRRDLPFVIVVPQAPFPEDRANPSSSRRGFAEKREASAAPPPRPAPVFATDPIPQDCSSRPPRLSPRQARVPGLFSAIIPTAGGTKRPSRCFVSP